MFLYVQALPVTSSRKSYLADNILSASYGLMVCKYHILNYLCDINPCVEVYSLVIF